MKKNQSSNYLVFFAALILVGIGVFLLSKSQVKVARNSKPVAMVAHISGNPQSREEGLPFWKPLQMGEPVFEGQKIKTSSKETVLIKTLTNDIIRVSENSTITIKTNSGRADAKIEVGNIEVFDKNQPTPQSMEALIEEAKAKALAEQKMSLKTENEVITLANPTSNLMLISPENKSTQVLNFEAPSKVDLAWVGKTGNDFEVEYKINDQSLSSIKSRQLHAQVLLPDSQLSGSIKWRVKDQTLGRTTDWFQFQYWLAKTPSIKYPYQSSLININSEIKNQVTQIAAQTSYQTNEFEITFPNEKRIVNSTVGSTSITSDMLTNYMTSNKIPIMVRVRALVRNNNWTQWSEPVNFNLVNASPLELSFSTSAAEMKCENQNWICVSPIRVSFKDRLNEGVKILATWSLSGEKKEYTNEFKTVSKTLTLCPPFPDSNWVLKVTEFNDVTKEYRISKSFKINSQVAHPPKLIANKTLRIFDSELLVEHESCPDIRYKAQIYEPDGTSTTAIFESSIGFYKGVTQTSTQLASQFVDTTETPISKLSEPVEIKSLAPSPSVQSQRAPTETWDTIQTTWVLTDASEVYVTESNGKAWSPISWRSNPIWPIYEYQIASDPNFKKLIETNKISRKNVKTMISDSNGVIYWRVRGIKEDTTTSWSESRKVQVTRVGKSKKTKTASEQSK